MAQFIGFMIATLIVGVVWGLVISSWFIKIQLSRGRVPKFLKENKDTLITLLKD